MYSVILKAQRSSSRTPPFAGGLKIHCFLPLRHHKTCHTDIPNPKLFCVDCRWGSVINSYPLVWTFSMMELDPCARLGPTGIDLLGHTCMLLSLYSTRLISTLLLRYIVSYACALLILFRCRLSICSKCAKKKKEWRVDSSCKVSAVINRVKEGHKWTPN